MSDLHRSHRLGDLLVEAGLITAPQLREAIELQKERRLNEPDRHAAHEKYELGEILIELGFINRHQLKVHLSWQRRLRKTTAIMVFIAPMLTAACGGGGGGGGSGASGASGTTQTNAPVTTSVTNPATNPVTSSNSVSSSNNSSVSPPETTVEDSPENVLVNTPVTNPTSGSDEESFSSSSSADETGNVGGGIATAPSQSSATIGASMEVASSSSSSVAAVAASSSSSKAAVTASSSSSVAALAASSASSSSKAVSSAAQTGAVAGPVQLYWAVPTNRENGDYLDVTEIGGYELRYRLKSDATYTTITIKDGFIDAYYFDYLQGDYEFQIATFDKQGLYSDFVTINPSS